MVRQCDTCKHHNPEPFFPTVFVGERWVRSTTPEFGCSMFAYALHYASDVCPHWEAHTEHIDTTGEAP